jgi:hypothetical protein
MPPPSLTIAGFITVDFLAVISASSLRFRPAFMRAELIAAGMRESRQTAVLVPPSVQPYIQIHESQRRIVHRSASYDHWAEKRTTADGRAAPRLLPGKLLRLIEQGGRQTLVPEYDPESGGRDESERRETLLRGQAGD